MQSPFNNFLNSNQKANATKSGLFYGNPRMSQAIAMSQPNETCSEIIKSGALNKYYNMPYQSFVEFTGATAKKELAEMLKIQSAVTVDDIKFINKCEDDHAATWVDVIKEIGLPEIDKKEFEKFIDVTDGVLYNLKYYYQRPRPEQLAYFYGVKLYPLLATSACSPSYPGGHAFDAYRIAFLLGKRYPEKSPQLLSHAERVSMSRVQGGVHYPSDSIISKMLARELVDQGFFDSFLEHSK